MPKLGMEPIRRKQLTEALWTILAREGMSAVTLDRVSAKAGVSKGVTAYYFKTKDRLILEGIQTFLESYSGAMESVIQNSSREISCYEFLLLLCRSVLGWETEGNPGTLSVPEVRNLLIEIYSLLPRSQELQSIMKEVYKSYLQSFSEVLKMGNDSGEWSCKECETTGLNLMALLDGMLLYSLFSFKSTEEEQMDQLRVFLKSCLDGIQLV